MPLQFWNGKHMLSEHSKHQNPSAWIGWGVIIFCTLLGLVGLGGGAWRAVSKAHDSSANTSAAMYTLIDTENVLENQISAAVLPARKRTELLAAEPDVIKSLLGKDSKVQTELLNAKIRSATEIDAVALFNSAGEITAINTCYANGQPIADDRVKRVLGAKIWRARNHSELPAQRFNELPAGISNSLRYYASIFRFNGFVGCLFGSHSGSQYQSADRGHQFTAEI